MCHRQVQQMCKRLNDEDAELPGGERQHDQVFPMVRHGQILIRSGSRKTDPSFQVRATENSVAPANANQKARLRGGRSKTHRETRSDMNALCCDANTGIVYRTAIWPCWRPSMRLW